MGEKGEAALTYNKGQNRETRPRVAKGRKMVQGYLPAGVLGVSPKHQTPPLLEGERTRGVKWPLNFKIPPLLEERGTKGVRWPYQQLR